MKIKFNWGTGIVLALLIMISGMIVLVSIAVRQDYDLVDKDYYRKSVNFQQHIEKVKNNEALTEKIQVKLAADSLILAFPNLGNYQDYSGEIHFYSPVAEKRDFKLAVKPDSGFIQVIGLKYLEKGRYQVKIDWTAGTIDYYQEVEIVVEQ